MAKKKKMTKAQAAAARREPTARSVAKKRSRENAEVKKEETRAAKAQAKKSIGFTFVVPAIIIAVIVIMSIVFTVAPGMFMGS